LKKKFEPWICRPIHSSSYGDLTVLYYIVLWPRLLCSPLVFFFFLFYIIMRYADVHGLCSNQLWPNVTIISFFYSRGFREVVQKLPCLGIGILCCECSIYIFGQFVFTRTILRQIGIYCLSCVCLNMIPTRIYYCYFIITHTRIISYII